MQRVPHVKEIDKKFKAFPQTYLFNKSTDIIHIEKEHINSFHLISRMGSSSNYSLRLGTLNDGGPVPLFDLQLINLELYS